MLDSRISLDGAWEFLHVADDRLSGPAEVRPVAVPAPWQSQFADLRMRAGIGIYRRSFDIPEGWISDSVSLPFRLGFPQAYAAFAREGIADRVVWIGSGKLGLPENAAVAFALGVDLVNVAREAMMSIGCIQAQKCHTDHCPVGVATQNPRYTRGLDVSLKSVRAANYVRSLRRDLIKVSEAIGVVHPGLIAPHDVDFATGTRSTIGLAETYGYDPSWPRLGAALVEEIEAIMVAQDATHSAAAEARP